MAPGTRPVKVLRVPRSDEKDSCTIFHVHPSAATIELNCKVTATDGESGYVLDLKESRVSRYRESDQDEEDWKSVLRATLLADPRDEDRDWLPKIELSSHLKKENIVLEFRQDISGIKQRLGSIEIPSRDDVEIELWGWLSETCQEKDKALAKLRTAEQAAAKGKNDIDELKLQLQNLTAAKKEHEEDLILKFQQLLNEKKKKIRMLSQIRASPLSSSSPMPAALNGGRGKRKADASIENDDEDEEQDAFAPVDVDKPKQSDNDTDSAAEICETSDDDVTSDDEDVADIKAGPVEMSQKKVGAGKKISSRKAPNPVTPEEDTDSDDEL